MSQLAIQFAGDGTVAPTKYVVYPNGDNEPRTEGNALETFQLSQEELLTFHELNCNPPAISRKVVDRFQKKQLAQD